MDSDINSIEVQITFACLMKGEELHTVKLPREYFGNLRPKFKLILDGTCFIFIDGVMMVIG